MTRTRNVTVVLAAVLLAAAVSAPADDLGVTLRGFVSQGYLRSSANRLLSAPTDDGSFAFTEAALNFAAEPLPRVRVAAQLFARDLGSQGNNRAVLDWGLGEYRAWDALGFRAGRIKFPVGLYNTLADADVTRPEIFQPSGIYPPERRDLTNAIDGVGIFGTVDMRGAGYLQYEALVGTIDLDESYVLTRAARDTSASLAPALAALRLSGLDSVVSDRSGRATKSWGGYLEWHPPVSGLRLRTGLQGARVDFSVVTTFSGFAGPAPVSLVLRSDLTSEVPHQVIFSGEYSRGGLRLTAEHLRGRVENVSAVRGLPFPVPPQPLTVTKPVSTYGQVAYRYRRVQGSTYYSVNYLDSQDKDGRSLVLRGQPAHGAWLKDLAFTLGVDVNSHWLLKAEVHRFDGTANLSPAENPLPLEKDWRLLVLKTTVHF